jgi:hypothetical protein
MVYVTLSISDSQPNNTLPICQMECHCAECHILFIIKLNVIILSVVALFLLVVLTFSTLKTLFSTNLLARLKNSGWHWCENIQTRN